jgi:hypothetical protein
MLEFDVSDYPTAKRMVEAHHYSGCMPRGRNICYEWVGPDGVYACAVYGNGINPYQASFLARVTGLPVTKGNYVELKRLVRCEPRIEGVQLTQFLAMCHADLAQDGWLYVVSFSDPEQGHAGTIYKAANFFDLGQTQAEWHVVDADGKRRHRRVAYRHSRLHGITIAEARAALGFTRERTMPRDRWFWPIRRPDRRRLASRLLDEALRELESR